MKQKAALKIGPIEIISIFAAGIVVISVASCREPPLSSCRNHASFLAMSLDAYIKKNNALPFVQGEGGQIPFILPPSRAMENCNLAAPGKNRGGWQVVNVDSDGWDVLLEKFGEGPIPFAWCGKPHKRNGLRERIVLSINGHYMTKVASVNELVSRLNSDEVFFWPGSISYGMEDTELGSKLEKLNEELERLGYEKISIDL